MRMHLLGGLTPLIHGLRLMTVDHMFALATRIQYGTLQTHSGLEALHLGKLVDSKLYQIPRAFHNTLTDVIIRRSIMDIFVTMII